MTDTPEGSLHHVQSCGRQGLLSNHCSPRVLHLLSAMHRYMVKEERRAARAVLSPEEYLEKEEPRVASLRETKGLPTVSRRAEALRHIAQHLTPQIMQGELVVGSQRGNMGWLLAAVGNEAQVQRQREIHQAYQELGICFGKGHIVADYAQVLRKGFGGIEREATAMLYAPDVTPGQRDFLNAVRACCHAARNFAERHADQAEKLMRETGDLERQKELVRIAAVCRRVTWRPARNLHEAIQSFWFTHVLLHIESPAVAYSTGRTDQYLWPFYATDIASGCLTREEAVELLDCLLIKLCEGDESQNMVVGGIHFPQISPRKA